MLSILIADDEAFLLHILAEKIGRAGHEVTTASDGQQGFELASKLRPDLIITDFQMPVMTGLEMSAKLRVQNETAHIPILLVTARGHRVESEELSRTNIVAVIAKPFSAKELLSKIEQIAAGIERARVAKGISSMSSTILEKYRPIHNALAERCSTMGVLAWLFDGSGKRLISPGENTWVHTLPDAFVQTAAEIAKATLESRTPLEQSRDGIWWVPLTYTQGSQIAAVSVAAVLVGGPLRKALLEATGPRHARALLDQLPRRRSARQLVQIVQWAHADLCASRRHGSMLDEFSEQLSQAFEELNLVFRMSHLLNSTHPPQEIVHEMCDELRKSLSFGWVCIHFCASRDAVPELTSRILTSGNPPGGVEAAIAMCSEISRGWTDSVATKILRPESDPLARQCNSEVLVQPVLHDGRPVALIFAGNKQSADSDVCSIEIQMLQAAARFMGMAHQNMTRFSEQRQMFLGTVQSLTAAVDAKDSYTRGHSERVGMLARQMAEALGLEPEVIHQYYVAGLLHDVGKIGIPESVLGKTGKLTEAEFDIIKKHPEIGHHILTGIPSLDSILPGVLHHHERWDGHGYPHGLAGDKIPFIARVLGVCDTFDAMNSRRSYRDNLPRPYTIAELKRVAGSQFDPSLVPIFLNIDLTQYDRAVADSEALLARAA